MKKTEIKKGTFNQLTPFFKEHGFTPQKGNDRFVRKTDFGFHGVSFHIIQRNNYSDVSFHYSIRFNAIEEIANQIITVEPKFQKGTTTLLVVQKFLDGLEKDTYRISSMEDLEKCFANITEDDFSIASEKVFENYDTIEKVDELLNSSQEKHTMLLNNKEQHCYKGLIVGTLVKNPDINTVDSSYLKIIEGMANHIQENYAKLRALLQLI